MPSKKPSTKAKRARCGRCGSQITPANPRANDPVDGMTGCQWCCGTGDYEDNPRGQRWYKGKAILLVDGRTGSPIAALDTTSDGYQAFGYDWTTTAGSFDNTGLTVHQGDKMFGPVSGKWFHDGRAPRDGGYRFQMDNGYAVPATFYRRLPYGGYSGDPRASENFASRQIADALGVEPFPVKGTRRNPPTERTDVLVQRDGEWYYPEMFGDESLGDDFDRALAAIEADEEIGSVDELNHFAKLINLGVQNEGDAQPAFNHYIVETTSDGFNNSAMFTSAGELAKAWKKIEQMYAKFDKANGRD